jgi:hypothetical protein
MKKYLLFLFMIAAMKYGHAQDKMLTSLDSSIKQPGKSKRQSISKFTIKVYGGFGLFSPGSYRIQSTNDVFYPYGNYGYTDTVVHSQGKKGIGGGWRLGGGLGYVINDYLNIGIDFEYQGGVRLSNALNSLVSIVDYDSTEDKMHYKVLSLTPYITFKALAKPNYFIYNKLGIVLTFPFTLYTSGNSTFSYGSNWPPAPPTYPDTTSASYNVQSGSYEGKYSISMGIGFNAAFGINIRMNNRWRIFAELFGNFSALKPTKSVVTNMNGSRFFRYTPTYDNSNPPNFLGWQINENDNLTITQVKTKYHKGGLSTSVQEPYNSGGNPTFSIYDAVAQDFTVNLNSIGINCGIIYRF